MKKILIVILMLLVTLAFAESNEINAAQANWPVSVYITMEDGSSVPTGGSNLYVHGTSTPTDCDFMETGLYFATWFSDVSEGDLTSVMLPGDGSYGHSHWGDIGGMGLYTFNTTNFYNSDRSGGREFDDGVDTLHIRLMYQDSYDEWWVWAIDQVFSASDLVGGAIDIYGGLVNINASYIVTVTQ